MNYSRITAALPRVGSLGIWSVTIFIPLAFLFGQVILFGAGSSEQTQNVLGLTVRSFSIAAVIAFAAVAIGYIPGRLLGTSRSRQYLLLGLLLMPLVLPRYVLYYAWSLLLSPTTAIGMYLSSRGQLARLIGNITTVSVLIFWYWPLAALLIGQGWRNIDSDIFDNARLDADVPGRFSKIILPLMIKPLALAFGVCFVLSLSEFTTFNLAGIQTVGTELAVLYELTGSEVAVARAAWPVVVAAIVCAAALSRTLGGRDEAEAGVHRVVTDSQRWRWVVLLVLVTISLVLPIVILLANISGTQAFRQYAKVHSDELAWSLLVAVVTAVIAHLIAFSAVSLDRSGRFGRLVSSIVYGTIFLAMLIPASLAAVSVLKLLAVLGVGAGLRQSWLIVPLGQAMRFAGVVLVLLLLCRISNRKQLSEAAQLDGATRFQTLLHVHLPQVWPVVAGSLILVIMLSVTELSATMVLLPAGLPNFAQSLLNQMHYARDQQVIASILLLIGLFLLLGVVVVLLLRVFNKRRAAMLMCLTIAVMTAAGCDDRTGNSEPRVVRVFGQTGRGPCEFLYPRAIDMGSDGSISVIDKTGRIQKFSHKGEFQSVIQMPSINAGKPVGITLAADGNLYVADTHYSRVVVFSPDGKIVRQFGQFGTGSGQFINPTDVEFSGDSRIFVSECGGNDRISVFDEGGQYLYSFGTSGVEEGQLSRPSALCVDRSRECLYVADACNHRIAVYTLDGKLIRYIGRVGCEPGQMRYPYDLDLLQNGDLVVCEYGNNRLQLFSPDGRSLGVFGKAGREPGQLAFPWGVTVDKKRRAFVVDAGNNRIQVWQL